MRDLMLVPAVAALFIMGLRNPFIAYLAWGWTATMALDNYMYGFMATMQLNMMFALLSLTHLLVGSDKLKQPPAPNRTSVLITLFVLQAFVAAIAAYPGMERNWEHSTDLFKMLAFCLAMPLLVTNRLRLHALLLALVLAMSFHGLLDGLKLIASGGKHLAGGVKKFGDNNHFAVMIAMVIPLTYFLAQHSAHRLVRIGFSMVTLLTVLGVVATQSRGGLLCVAIMAVWLIKNSRRKFAITAMVLLAAGAVVAIAPEHWIERMNTIDEADQDSSFMGRVMAWKRSSAMAMAHPFVGAGLGSAAAASIYWKFADEPGFLGFIQTPPADGIAFVAHSIYFQVLGDMGFVGFFIFVAILVNAFLTRLEIRRRIKASKKDLVWARDLADMLSVSVIAFAVGGALVSIAFQEFFYMILMLMEVLRQQVIRECAAPPLAGAPAGELAKA